jgi:hypothetical protein
MIVWKRFFTCQGGVNIQGLMYTRDRFRRRYAVNSLSVSTFVVILQHLAMERLVF